MQHPAPAGSAFRRHKVAVGGGLHPVEGGPPVIRKQAFGRGFWLPFQILIQNDSI